MTKVTKITKIISIMLVIMIIFALVSNVFGAGQVISSMSEGSKIDSSKTGDLGKMAGNVVGFIRTAAVILGVILLTVIGIKFMLGSAEEKAEYKKSLVPLVVGIVVVMASAQIATMLFNFFGNQ